MFKNRCKTFIFKCKYVLIHFFKQVFFLYLKFTGINKTIIN